MDIAFAPAAGTVWTPVSSKLRTMRRILAIAGLAVPMGFGVVLCEVLGGGGWFAIPIAAFALVGTYAWWSIGRNWRSWGYAERADDLLITHGAFFRRLVVVPYGRMQLVDVEAGPIERMFGLVRVKLHTASAGTDACIEGLTQVDAAALRDRLAALGEARAAGL